MALTCLMSLGCWIAILCHLLLCCNTDNCKLCPDNPAICTSCLDGFCLERTNKCVKRRNCRSCNDQGGCMQCMPGHCPNKNQDCADQANCDLCSSGLNGDCATCVRGFCLNKAKSCSSNTLLPRCAECPTVAADQEPDENTTCARCRPGYCLATNQGFGACTLRTNCKLCSIELTGTCLLCEDSFCLNANGQCIDSTSLPNCLLCNGVQNDTTAPETAICAKCSSQLCFTGLPGSNTCTDPSKDERIKMAPDGSCVNATGQKGPNQVGNSQINALSLSAATTWITWTLAVISCAPVVRTV